MRTRIVAIRNRLYRTIAGEPPFTNIFHHQHLMASRLLYFAATALPSDSAELQLLDVGCAAKPYRKLRPLTTWVGIDISDVEGVDYLVTPGRPWPLASGRFDVALCSQVLEHVEEPSLIVSEMHRTLKQGGIAIVNAPFLYPIHGAPHDYGRYTQFALRHLFEEWEVVEVGEIGGVGTSVASLCNNWFDYTFARNDFLSAARFILLPFVMVSSLVCNVIGLIADRLDSTKSFPVATYIIARKTYQSVTS